MSTTLTQITQLDAMAARLRAQVPDLGAAVVALLPELRAVDRLGLIAGRSRLGVDAENLARDAEDLLALREAGVRNADTDAAADALLTLIADMRVRVSGLIKGRTASLRINTEVSAAHADPEADTVDLTDGFRLMAAHPTPRDAAADGLVITDLGLPETGGKVGRITGKIRGAGFAQPEGTYRDGAGPIDTYYLPAGHSVRLAQGEQIRIHSCGNVFLGDDETLTRFSHTPSTYEVQAVGDDVEIHGPATFSVSREMCLGNIFAGVKALEMANIPKPDMMDDDDVPIIGALWVIPNGFVVAGTAAAGDYGPAAFAALVTLLYPGWRLLRSWMLFKKCAALPESTKDLAQRLGERVFGKDFVLGDSATRNLLPYARKHFGEHKGLNFYPLRKVIASETKGVQEIRPLAALPAPSPTFGFDDDRVVAMPVRKPQGAH